MKMFNSTVIEVHYKKLIVLLYFLVWIIVGFSVYKDFGISWDENYARELNGMKTYKFLTGEDEADYLSCSERFHGPIFELLLYKLERIFNWGDVRNVFFNRHLVTYLLYIISAFCIYLLSQKLFRSIFIGLFAATLYLLYPKLFPDAFYNSKDSANTAFMAISLYTMYLFTIRPNIKSLLLHSLVCGIFVGVRITGVILPLATIGIFLFRNLIIIKSKRKSGIFIYILMFIISCIGFIIISWPVLWSNPIDQFVLAWTEMSKFNWISTTTFLGKFVWSNDLPWFYIPIWILFSTPTYYILLFVTGVIFLFFDLVKRKSISNDQFFFTSVVLALFVVPMVAVVFFNSVVYDGWRHLYFIYPCFVIVATYSVYRVLIVFSNFKKQLYVLFCVPFIFIAIESMALHPYQHLYINNLYYNGISDARFNMEMDYWGLTYRRGLEWILKNDDREYIKVKADNYPGELNALMIKSAQRSRLIFVKEDVEADYFIGNYRWRQSEYEYESEVYSLNVDGAKVVAVYKLK